MKASEIESIKEAYEILSLAMLQMTMYEEEEFTGVVEMLIPCSDLLNDLIDK
jgi:hypothetical protein